MYGRAIAGNVFTLAVTVFVILAAVPVRAEVFQPVIDAFRIYKNGDTIFRDSFDDGIAPPDGPNGSETYITGAAGPAFTGGEAGGALTITPSLGTPAAITTSTSTANTFAGAIRRFSTNPASGQFLGFSDSFSIFGLFDMSALPTVPGQSFGIRATDRAPGNAGNNVAQLTVRQSGATGEVGVGLTKLDFDGDTREVADFVSIDDLLGMASKIRLGISKEADSAEIAAQFVVYDALMNVLCFADLDTTLNTSLTPIQLYDGEAYARAQFFATDSISLSAVPLPDAFPLFLVALSTLGLLGWYRRQAR